MQQIDYEVYDLVIVNAKLFVAAVLFDRVLLNSPDFEKEAMRMADEDLTFLNVPKL